MSCVAVTPDHRTQRRGAGVRINRTQGVAARYWIMALAGFGLLVGPSFVAALVLLPLTIIIAGFGIDDAVVQGVGLGMLVVHGIAVATLLRVHRLTRSRRQAVALSHDDAPELHDMIAALARTLNAPPVARVLIDTHVNASVAQIPVIFGIAGHRHELTLGLPLLLSISRYELAAVIAHELAHCRHSDGRLQAIVFRAHQQWLRLQRASRTGSFLGRFLLNSFARWYLPVLERQSAQVLRSGEYIADQEAARAVGAETLARALVRAHVARNNLQDAWDGFWLRNVREARPLAGPWQTFVRTLRPPCGAIIGPHLTRNSNQQQAPANGDSHHPSLEERLSALELPMDWPRKTETRDNHSAASVMLGKALVVIATHFDKFWWQDNSKRWQTFYSGVAAQKARLQALDEAATRDALSTATAIERAVRAEYLIGPDAAIARYRWCVNRFPSSATAYANLGELFVRLGQREGHAFLSHARSLETKTT